MGYTTSFKGRFNLDKPLTVAHKAYLHAFSETRRMKRDGVRADVTLTDPVRVEAGLPVGLEGGYFVGNAEDFGQKKDASILEYNSPPAGQPGLWCQWEPTKNGKGIEWNGAEKFSMYVEWLQYLITNFLAPWGYKLNGEVKWRGEERSDTGTITVVENTISITATAFPH